MDNFKLLVLFPLFLLFGTIVTGSPLSVADSPEKSAWLCPICECLVMQAKDIAVSTESQLLDLANCYCIKFFGDNWTGHFCEQVIDNFVPQIFKYIQENLDPYQICTGIGLCYSHPNAPAETQMSAPNCPASFICYLCDFVMDEIQNFLSQQDTETAVRSKFLSFCNLATHANQTQECTRVFGGYFNEIWEFATSTQLNGICKVFGFCNSHTTPAPTTIISPTVGPQHYNSSLPSPWKAVKCNLCYGITEILMKKSSTSRDKVKSLALNGRKACAIFGTDSARNMCHTSFVIVVKQVETSDLQISPDICDHVLSDCGDEKSDGNEFITC